MTNSLDITNEGSQNPLLRKVKLPGKRIRLPSHAAMYDKGELDPNCKNGEIEIFPLTALDEIVLNNADKILNGDGLTEVLSRCAPEIKKPLEIFTNDLDYIMTNIQALTFGEQYRVNYIHDCKDAKTHEYTIDLNVIVQSTKHVDPSTIASVVKLNLPNGQVVNMRPLRVKHLINLVNAKNTTETFEEMQVHLLEAVVHSIEDVDGITDLTHLVEWIKEIPANYIEKLTKRAEEVAQWGPVLESKIKCKDCEKELDVPLAINPINFFL